jgi:arylsulfatase A-like enzyme
MNRSLILLFAILNLLSCKVSEDVPTPVLPNRPNILFIIADDLGLDATPGFTEGVIKPNMPNLEGLISSGIRFSNLWSAPTCTPTRATVLTGKYGVETEVLAVGDELSTREISLQSYLDDQTSAAYRHAVIGKWHLSNSSTHPNEMGIDYFAGFLRGFVPSYENWQLIENGITTTSTTYSTTKFTDLAIDWIQSQEQAWFLWLAYNAPHTPFHLPSNELHSQGDLPAGGAAIAANPLPYYLASLEAMDSEMGRLFDSMNAAERANTVIIFIGDNGTPNRVAQLPYGAGRAKGTIFQGGINVPMVVSGYGVERRGAEEKALINTTDLFATIADLAGTGTTSIHQSISFKPLLTDEKSAKRAYAYAEIEGEADNGYTIRNEGYKLIVFNNGDQHFYNLREDPYESTNLLDRTLNEEELRVKMELESEALAIRE